MGVKEKGGSSGCWGFYSSGWSYIWSKRGGVGEQSICELESKLSEGGGLARQWAS